MSPGDLFDRIAVLRVKIANLGGREELLSELGECEKHEFPREIADQYIHELEVLNSDGWKENEIIFEMAKGELPSGKSELKRLAEAVFKAHSVNRLRVELKNSINERFGYSVREIKSWQ